MVNYHYNYLDISRIEYHYHYNHCSMYVINFHYNYFEQLQITITITSTCDSYVRTYHTYVHTIRILKYLRALVCSYPTSPPYSLAASGHTEPNANGQFDQRHQAA